MIRSPFSSSWHASMDSTASSQLPLGTFHSATLALAGGVLSAGWTPFLRDRFAGAALGVEELGRPRFFVFRALSTSSKTLSRPPMLSRYSSRTSEALSLQGKTL